MTVIVAGVLFAAVFLGGIGFYAFQDNLTARNAESRAAIAAGLQSSLATQRAQVDVARAQADQADANRPATVVTAPAASTSDNAN